MKKRDEIAAELKALRADFGETEASDSTFHVPEGYFNDFPGQMAAIVQAMNADTSFDPGIKRQEPFEVPQGYFEQFSHNIMQQVSAMEQVAHDTHHSWGDAQKETPYHLPENYFTEFEQQLMHTIFHEEKAVQEEIQALSPLLADLKKEQPFTVPQGYFNGDAFVQHTQRPEVKVIQHPAVRSIKWAGWAAAAAVIGIFIMGGLHYLNPSSGLSSKQSFEQSLAKIPDARIKEWLISNMDEADINSLGNSIVNIKTINASPRSLDNYSEKELRDYLEAEL